MRFRIPLLATIVVLLLTSTLFAQKLTTENWRERIGKYATRLGVTPVQMQSAELSGLHTDEKTGITYCYVQQRWQGLVVHNSLISLSFREDKLLYHSGRFLKTAGFPAARPTAGVSPAAAVQKAAEAIGAKLLATPQVTQDRFQSKQTYTFSKDNISRTEIPVTQYWLPDSAGKNLVLVWSVLIDDKRSDDYWDIRVDAVTGRIVDKRNRTIYENPDAGHTDHVDESSHLPIANAVQGIKRAADAPPVLANYQVLAYPKASPDAGAAELLVDPWNVFGAGNPATTLGWHSTDVDYNITRGNNTFTFLGTNNVDIADPVNNWPDTTNVPGPRLYFMQIPDFSILPNDSFSRKNKKFALDNAFYWTNMLHDMTYQYGFTEEARNFQELNLGRGGEEDDPVIVKVQDRYGINNANFLTPRDGEYPRMRIYLWTNPTAYFTINETFGPVQYEAMENRFNSPNKLGPKGPLHGEVVLYNDDASGTVHHGCQPATNDISGKIALVDAVGGPGCPDFAFIARNCQNQGAIGVIVYSQAEFVFAATGTDQQLRIPLIVINNSTGVQMVDRLEQGEVLNVSMSAFYRDAALDNGVIAHEYMHGVTSRLTANGEDCLYNAETPSEGWSDYLGLMMTTDWENTTLGDENTPRGIGAYSAAVPYTIRRFPYSTDLSVQPLTYADVAGDIRVHRIGEVWCATLWDMTWEIIKQNGTITGGFLQNTGTGGNVVAMNLVMTALKMQPCKPGFLDARDAILAADSALYNGQYHCAIWRAFARRGMGYSASQGLPIDPLDQVAAFDLPLEVLGIKETILYTGNSIKIEHTISSPCQTLNGYIVRDTIPAGFTYISSSPAGILNGNVLEFPSTDFPVGETTIFSITLMASGTGCKPDTLLFDNRDDFSPNVFTSTADAGLQNWTVVPGGLTGNAWYIPDPDGTSVVYLTSTPTMGDAGKPLSTLSFWHSFDTEYQFDGGYLEYSTDGIVWRDLGQYFIKNGYTEQISNFFTPWQSGFTGNSNGYIQSIVDLTELGTGPLQFRFTFVSDAAIGGVGWYLDNILRENRCGGLLQTGVYPAAGNNVTYHATTTLVLEPLSTLPLELVSINARADGQHNVVEWETHDEVNVKKFEVEFSTDGRNWSNIGEVAARNAAVNRYEYAHTRPLSGVNQYRLKMLDVDQTFTYSPVRIVRRTDDASFTLRPNPVGNTARFDFSPSLGVSSIRLFDATGRLLKDVTVGSGAMYKEIDVTNLPAGVYLVKATDRFGGKVVRMVKK